MTYNRLFFLSSLCLFVLFNLLGCSFQKADKSKSEEFNTYSDKKFHFSVQFPKGWSYQVSPYVEATVTREATPDSGINIYIGNNKVDRMYVFGQNGYIHFPLEAYEAESFVTLSGMQGTLYSNEIDGKKDIRLLFNDAFIGAYVTVSLTIYQDYEKQIKDILKSIKVDENHLD